MFPLGSFSLFVITSQTNAFEVHFINKHLKNPNHVSSYFVLPTEKWSARTIFVQALICFSHLTGETLEFPLCISAPITIHWAIITSQFTVDDTEGQRTNSPERTLLPRCYEQREEESRCIRNYYCRGLIGNTEAHPFTRKMYRRNGLEKIKGGTSKGSQNRLQEGNGVEYNSWELSCLRYKSS